MAFSLAENLPIGGEEIAIALTHGLFGTHLGVAYVDEEGTARLLHLAFHKMLFVVSYPQPNWIASQLLLPPFASSQAVALLRGMAEKYQGVGGPGSIDYGINLFAGRDAIKPDATYEPGEGCDGFTCSSFVVAVIERVGFPLVDLSTWQCTEANLAWGRAVVCLLNSFDHVPKEHVALVEQNNQGLRLRPEEVAAAAEIDVSDRPAKSAALAERAEAILTQMLNLCGPPIDSTGKPYHQCVVDFNNAKIA